MGSITASIILWLLLSNNYALAQTNQPAIFLSIADKKDSKTEKDDRDRQEKQKPLDFSDTGRPGQQTAGESRGGCPNLNDKIKAVVPVSHAGKTVASHPNFWVHFPYGSKQISYVEFAIQNEAREDIWRSQSKLDENIGYKNFSLPKTESPLKIGQWYRWYVKVYCRSNTASAQYVQSWVERVPLNSKLYLELQQQSQPPYKTYGNYGIWYDSVDLLLTEYQRDPDNLALEKDWQNLIRSKGVELQALPKVGVSYEAVK